MCDSGLLYGWRGGSVLHTQVCASTSLHFACKFPLRLEDWGRGGVREMDRVRKGERKRREKEGAMTELKALCLYMRLQAN